MNLLLSAPFFIPRALFLCVRSRDFKLSTVVGESPQPTPCLQYHPFVCRTFLERGDDFHEAMPKQRCRHFKRRRRFETSHFEDIQKTTTPLPPSVDRTQKRRGGGERRRREETAARTGGVGIQVLIRRGVPGVPLAESRVGRYDSDLVIIIIIIASHSCCLTEHKKRGCSSVVFSRSFSLGVCFACADKTPSLLFFSFEQVRAKAKARSIT